MRTGIKHQLRAHCSQYLKSEYAAFDPTTKPYTSIASAPILGDSLYLSPQSSTVKTIRQNVKVPHGLYLHAHQISFNVSLRRLLFFDVVDTKYVQRYRPQKFQMKIVCPIPAAFQRVCAQTRISLSKDQLFGGIWIDGEKLRGHQISNPSETDEDPLREIDAVEAIGGKWYGPSLHSDSSTPSF